MTKRIKHPSVGAFNAGRASIHSLHPQPRRPTDTVQQYQKLTVWEQQNNRTRKESRRLIRQNKLFAVKHHGIWWVAINPNCEEQVSDL